MLQRILLVLLSKWCFPLNGRFMAPRASSAKENYPVPSCFPPIIHNNLDLAKACY